MRKLLSPLLLLAALCSPVPLHPFVPYAAASETRDANGRITGSTTKTGGTEIMRDANGKITGTKTNQPDGTKVVRDANGQPVGKETK